MSERSQGRRSKARPRSRTAGFEQRLLQRLRLPGDHGRQFAVIGFSGGVDSCALASALARLESRAPIRPYLVHVNHNLRYESVDEATQALGLAESLGLPCEQIDLSPGFQANHPGVGIEEAARRERYLALAAVAKRLGTDIVATGHHQRDQAETVLLHLLRGSGVHGASAMNERSWISVPWWEVPPQSATAIWVWRPLLNEAKADIDAYVDSIGLRPVRDPSNDDRLFRRNAVRHEILPAIEAEFPGAAAALARFAEIAGAEDELLQMLTDDAYWQCKTNEGALRLTLWLDLPRAIQQRVMLTWLRERTRSTEVSLDRVLAVCELARARRRGPMIEVGGGRFATIVGDELIAGKIAEFEDPASRG
jgi:tRNA(Ile)-lysidine synthase